MLSPSAVTARHAGMSPAAQILCPLFFFSQIPGMKKTGRREGRSLGAVKRKLTASEERQD